MNLAPRAVTPTRVLRKALFGLMLLVPIHGVHAAEWVSTQTRALVPADAHPIGSASADAVMHIALSLKLPNPQRVQALIESQHTPGNLLFGTHLTPQQFTAAYAPSPQSVQAAVAHLRSNGFAHIEVSGNRLLVTADGTVAAAQRAFGTSITRYQRNGIETFSNDSAARVPAALGDIVLAVHGLQNVAHMQKPSHTVDAVAAATGPSTQGLLPPDFAVAYDEGNVAKASGSTVAIFMEGDVSQVLKDLRQEEAQDGLPQVPVKIVNTDAAGTDTSGVDEWDLDSQSSAGIAGDFRQVIWYVASTLDDAPLLTAMTHWVSDGSAIAANASFGECEDTAQSSGYLSASDQILMQAAAQGQTLFTSSGDNGFSCGAAVIPNGVPAGQPFISYAGSSPYAVAVGGTTLQTNPDFTYASEKTWMDGGGGTSVLEAMPSWQTGVVNGLADSLLGGKFKGTPDFSMAADPASGAIIIVDGKSEQVGGTSLSSPLAMGAWARLESQYGNRLGFAPPALYQLANGSTSVNGFHDVTTGSNVLYLAHAGWDYATGLGTIDLAAVSPLLANVTTSPGSGGGSSGSGGSGDGGGGGGAFPPLMVLGLSIACLARRRRNRGIV